MTKRVGVIQSLRGISILVVVFFHLGYLDRGFLGVDVFLVISGYLAAKTLKNDAPGNVYKFWKRRFQKVMPSYSLMLAALGCFGSVVLVGTDFCSFQNELLMASLFITNLQSFFDTSDYHQRISEFKFVAHTWSLCLEVQFYLLAPALFLLFNKQETRGCKFAWFLTTMLSFAWFLLLDDDLSFYLLPARLWQFTSGIIVYNWGVNTKIAQIIYPKLFVLFLLVLFSLPQIPILYARISVTLLTTPLISAIGNLNTDSYYHAPLKYIGDVSYQLYLIHWPLITFYVNLTATRTMSSKGGAVIFIASVLLAAIFTEHFEKWFLRKDFKQALMFVILAYLAIGAILCEKEQKLALSKKILPGCDPQMLEVPSIGNFTKSIIQLNESELFYAEMEGTGQYDILIIGNSFVSSYPYWVEKPFINHFKRLYVLSVTYCIPFLDFKIFKDKARVLEMCKNFEWLSGILLNNVQPDILFLNLGYSSLIPHLKNQSVFSLAKPHSYKKFQTFRKSGAKILIAEPIYYISSPARAHRIHRLNEKPGYLGGQDDYTYPNDEYLRQSMEILEILYGMTNGCRNCHFVHPQKAFTRDNTTAFLVDEKCGQFVYRWDGIHPNNFGRNLIELEFQNSIKHFLGTYGKQNGSKPISHH